jgi:hypothetical protein
MNLTDNELTLSTELVAAQMTLLRVQSQRDELLHGKLGGQLRELQAEQKRRADEAQKQAEKLATE